MSKPKPKRYPPPLTKQELDALEDGARDILALGGGDDPPTEEQRVAYVWLRLIGMIR